MKEGKMVRKHYNLYVFSLAILLLTQFFSAIPIDSIPLLSLIWFVWILLCSYYAILICAEKTMRRGKFFAIMILVFWAINAISYYTSPKIVDSFHATIETLVILKSVTITLFSYFPFYYYSKHGIINYSNLCGFIFLSFLTSIIRIIFENIFVSAETLEDNNVLNQAYLFVQLIPLIIIFFRRSRLYFLVAVSALLILWSSKRGAILCLSVELLVFFIYLIKEDTFGKRHRGLIVFLIAIMLLIGLYYILSNDFLQERLLSTGTENDKSGQIRTDMYEILYAVFLYSSSGNEILFGRGLAQTVSFTGNLAHQDWLELLIDNGIVGLIIYVLLLWMCIRNIFKCKKPIPKSIKYALICCVLNWLLMATYSMVYASRESFVLFLTLGIINGFIQREKQIGHMQQRIISQ